eukprot:CAMPEP_0182464940 /NCGR_PEP_ID=MMETSP1319-20130603/8913_1 /TAXON_ID=172717 /ORGANISM="Bolidomonas pacifica, Strain RCC208" /LENGTH=58 /DNA_ID=CAMNT_0024664613 /DNA_START=809 /DNA_END=985 /DNA_ORIENTATION=-
MPMPVAPFVMLDEAMGDAAKMVRPLSRLPALKRLLNGHDILQTSQDWPVSCQDCCVSA